MSDAFSHEFRYAVHLTCFIHCRRNVKRKLQELGYLECATKEVLDDIFGCQHGSTFCEGLVDSSCEDEFHQKSEIISHKWSDLEKANSVQPGCFDWFMRYIATIMIRTMIKPVREEAALGSPPTPFTTNASESVSSIVKSHVSYRRSQVMELTDKLKEVIDEQEHEVDRAAISKRKPAIQGRTQTS